MRTNESFPLDESFAVFRIMQSRFETAKNSLKGKPPKWPNPVGKIAEKNSL